MFNIFKKKSSDINSNKIKILDIEKGFDPNKPNRLLKFILGKDYYSYPDYLSSELTKLKI